MFEAKLVAGFCAANKGGSVVPGAIGPKGEEFRQQKPGFVKLVETVARPPERRGP